MAFLILLAAPVPSSFRPGPLASLELTASAKAEEEVTDALYTEYRGLRGKLFTQIRKAHASLPALDVLGYARNILDRVLFIAFAQHRDLLPKNTLDDVVNHTHELVPTPIWQNLKVVFRWIDRGHPDQRFPAYGGGLFGLHRAASSTWRSPTRYARSW